MNRIDQALVKHGLKVSRKDFFTDGTEGSHFQMFGSEIVFRVPEDDPEAVLLCRYESPASGLKTAFRAIEWFALFLATRSHEFGIKRLRGLINPDNATIDYYTGRGAQIIGRDGKCCWVELDLASFR